MAPSRWRPQQGDTQPRQQRGQIQKQQHDDTVDAFTVLGWRVNCQRNISALAQSIKPYSNINQPVARHGESNGKNHSANNKLITPVTSHKSMANIIHVGKVGVAPFLSVCILFMFMLSPWQAVLTYKRPVNMAV